MCNPNFQSNLNSIMEGKSYYSWYDKSTPKSFPLIAGENH